MFPFGDSMPEPPNDKTGWWAAGIISVLGGIGTLWNLVRKGKTEDSTTALTHANTIIKGYERIVARQDERQRMLETEMAKRDTDWWKEITKIRTSMDDYNRREKQCQMRLEWLCGHLRDQNITVPVWPFPEEDEDEQSEVIDG